MLCCMHVVWVFASIISVGTCLSLTAADKSVGVVGMENGSLVKCVLTTDEFADPVAVHDSEYPVH